MKKVIPLKIRKAIRGLDSDLDEDDAAYKAAVMLLLPVLCDVRQNIKEIARLTGYGRKFVGQVSKNLRKNGIWRRSGTYHSGWDDDDNRKGGVAFWVDVCCGLGFMERVDKDDHSRGVRKP